MNYEDSLATFPVVTENISRGGNTAAETTSTLASQINQDNTDNSNTLRQGKNPKFVVNRLEPLLQLSYNKRKQVELTVGSIEDNSRQTSSIDHSSPEKVLDLGYSGYFDR